MPTERLILKELSRYRMGTWADIIYRNALLHADRPKNPQGKILKREIRKKYS